MKNLNKNTTNEKNLKHIVYITTNLVNYKKYIGSHVCKNIHDGYLGSGTYLKEDIKKYGASNFKREILANVGCPMLMKEMEEYYIEYYGAFESDLFYNKSRKGVGYPYGRKKPEWHNENIRNQRLGKPNGLKGRISPMKGKVHSPESKERARLNNLGKNNKPVLQYSKDGIFIQEFASTTEAGRALGKKTGAAIGECASGKRPSIYGYIWKFKTQ